MIHKRDGTVKSKIDLEIVLTIKLGPKAFRKRRGQPALGARGHYFELNVFSQYYNNFTTRIAFSIVFSGW